MAQPTREQQTQDILAALSSTPGLISVGALLAVGAVVFVVGAIAGWFS